MNALHSRYIDRYPALTKTGTRDVMAGRANRHNEIMAPGEANRRNHVGDPRAAHDQFWAAVDHCIVKLARLLITRFVEKEQLSPNGSAELIQTGY